LTKEPQQNLKTKQFAYYYVIEPEGNETPEIFESPFPMPTATALDKLNAQFVVSKRRPFMGRILRVTYDLIGRRFYLPDVDTTARLSSSGKMQKMFDAARIQVEREYGESHPPSADPPIAAEPSSSLRIKKISDYQGPWAFIKRAFGHLDISDIRVVEANLSTMPTTAASLRHITAGKKGAYISKAAGNVIYFMSKKTDKTESVLHSQSTPFILIDISPDMQTTYNDREIILISAFREAFGEEHGDQKIGGLTGAQFYSVEVMLYMGWSVEELCGFMISSNVTSAQQAISIGAHILLAAEGITEAGYRNPADRPYYYSFAFEKGLPLGLNTPGVFEILNIEGNFVIFRSLLFFSDDVLKRCFGAKSEIIRGQMEPQSQTFYVNRDASSLKENAPTCYWSMINHAKRSGTEDGEVKFKVMTQNELYFSRKRISQYPQAEQAIQLTCQRLGTTFDDLEVVVGPWMETGAPFKAAYMDRERALKNGGKIPVEPIPGVKIYPPFILIDSSQVPNVPDRTSSIIHEYRHYLNAKTGIVSPHDKGYGNEIFNDTGTFIKSYLGNKDEILAHVEQMKYMLALGMPHESILNYYMPQGIRTKDDVAKAARYNELLSRAANEIKMEDLIGPTEENFNVNPNARNSPSKSPNVGNIQG
jgi:hypothetical protein